MRFAGWVATIIGLVAVPCDSVLAQDAGKLAEHRSILNEAKGIRDRGDSKKAEQLVSGLLKELPAKGEERTDLAFAFLLRAECKEMRHEYKQAVPDVLEYFALNPAARWSCFGYRILAEAGDYKDAIKQLKRVVFSISNHGPPYALLAICAACDGDYRLAVDSLLKAQENKFSSYDMQIEKGPFVSHETIGVIRQRCESALKRNLTDTNARFALAIMGALVKSDRQAAAELAKVIKSKPNLAAAYAARANSSLAAGDPKSGLNEINRAIELDPATQSNYEVLQKFYSAMGNFDGIFAEFDRRLELQPKNTALLIAKANASKKIGKGTNATHCYEKAVEIDPKCVEAYCGLGLNSEGTMQYEEALRQFNKALKVKPTDLEALRDRATCYFALKKYKEAAADLTAVIAATDDPFAYESRAVCYKKLGDPVKARHDQKMASQNTPNY